MFYRFCFIDLREGLNKNIIYFFRNKSLFFTFGTKKWWNGGFCHEYHWKNLDWIFVKSNVEDRCNYNWHHPDLISRGSEDSKTVLTSNTCFSKGVKLGFLLPTKQHCTHHSCHCINLTTHLWWRGPREKRLLFLCFELMVGSTKKTWGSLR